MDLNYKRCQYLSQKLHCNFLKRKRSAQLLPFKAYIIENTKLQRPALKRLLSPDKENDYSLTNTRKVPSSLLKY